MFSYDIFFYRKWDPIQECQRRFGTFWCHFRHHDALGTKLIWGKFLQLSTNTNLPWILNLEQSDPGCMTKQTEHSLVYFTYYLLSYSENSWPVIKIESSIWLLVNMVIFWTLDICISIKQNSTLLLKILLIVRSMCIKKMSPFLEIMKVFDLSISH